MSRAAIQRLPKRASYQRQDANAILDQGLVCHVGFVADEQPYVIPMAYARDGDDILLHGSVASRLLGHLQSGAAASVAVTLVDGLVLARSTFHHSMNYRSAVFFGRATRVTDVADKEAALETLVEHLVPGRTADARAANHKELAATTLLRFKVEQFSVKARSGPPVDTRSDMNRPIWAGVIPWTRQAGAPVPDPDLLPGTVVPDYVTRYRRP